MGWSYCGEDAEGQSMGYGVQALCDEPGCYTMIDRGLSYLCGDMHEDGEGCNHYFCGAHRVLQRCHRCEEKIEEE